MPFKTRCVICQNGQKNLRTILWMIVFQNTGTHPRVLLVNQLQSCEEKWYRASTVFFSHAEGPKLRDLPENQNHKGPVQKTHWPSRTSCRKFGDLINADHKVLSEGCESRNNHRHAVVVQDLATQWTQSYPCKKQKLLGRRRRAWKSSWNPRGNRKSFTLTIPWNLERLVKIFPGIIARLHHTDRRLMVSRKEQCAE